MPRAIATADQRPMSPELAAPTLPDLRRDVLRVLASAEGAWDDDEVAAAIDWWAPRRHDATRSDRVRAVLAQCRALGVVVDGTLTSAGRALLADDGSLAAALAQSLPGQVDQLILQADLTAIVPGLPTPALADLMRTVADAESTGAASVYRFSTDSIRRALDAGRTAGELLGELSRRGTVPQALAYLIEDVARRHAVLRIGSAATVLRCDDPVVLAGILADPGRSGTRALQRSRTRCWAPSCPPSTCSSACASWGTPCCPSRDGGRPPIRPDGLGAVSRRRRRAPRRSPLPWPPPPCGRSAPTTGRILRSGTPHPPATRRAATPVPRVLRGAPPQPGTPSAGCIQCPPWPSRT